MKFVPAIAVVVESNIMIQKAIIVSGFTETDRIREAKKMGVGSYLKKPYLLKNIGIAVKKELDNEKGGLP